MIVAVAMVVALFGAPDYASINPIQVENLKPGIELESIAATPCPCPPPQVELDGALVDPALDLHSWSVLAGCESGHRWDIAPRRVGGPSGYVQIIGPTWIAYGGLDYAAAAYLAEPSQQLEVARRILDGGGWSQWECARRVGFR